MIVCYKKKYSEVKYVWEILTQNKQHVSSRRDFFFFLEGGEYKTFLSYSLSGRKKEGMLLKGTLKVIISLTITNINKSS